MTLEEVEKLGGYSVIYADPPWKYRDAKNPRGGADAKYETMPTPEICLLNVDLLAAPDCWLFVWGTWPNLADVLAVTRAWGFEYKTCAFDWVKTYANGDPVNGMGHYTRSSSEPCFVGTRGKLARLDKGVRQVVQETVLAPAGEHSAKPAEVRDRIVRLVGDLPRIELFARERVAGWDAWGNDPRIGEPDVRLL